MKVITVFSFLTFFILPFSYAFSQSDNSAIKESWNTVEEVNKLQLKKSVISSASRNIGIIFPDYHEVYEQMSFIYCDSLGIIRKFITMLNHPELSGYTVHYFDSNGNSVYSLIYYKSYMSPHFYGHRYMSGTRHICSDMVIYDEDADTWDRIYYNDGNVFETYSNSFDQIVSAENVIPFCKRYYKLEDTNIGDLGTDVNFSIPDKGDKTIINAHGVNVRNRGHLLGNILFNPLFGEIVEIIEKGPEELIDGYGEFNWYKIRIKNEEGFVFGAFLEPIERVIK